MMEMKCERFYFYDRSVENCMSCEDLCNPYRHATENECQIHCSAYLHWRNQFTTAGDRELPLFAAAQTSSLTILILIIVLVLVGFIAVAIFSVCLLYKRKCGRRCRSNEKGNYAEDIDPKDESFIKPVINSEVPTSPYDPLQFRSSSMCEQYDKLSIVKDPHVYIEMPPRSVSLTYTPRIFSQETDAEDCSMSPTLPKEAAASFAMQHQNEPASPLSPVIDLHEDFDCVEQTFDLAPRIGHGADAVVSNFSFDDDGKKNLQVAAILQRLRWVKQFWWDIEGAKIVVEASRQSTAKEDIKNILQREGISPSEFSFELFIPEPIFLPDSNSINSELNS